MQKLLILALLMGNCVCAHLGTQAWEESGVELQAFIARRHEISYIIIEKSLEIWQKSKVQIAKREYKTPFSLHNTCNELEGMGWS